MMLNKRDQAAELVAEVERLRISDPLTQLSNRARFSAQLSEFLKRDPLQTSVSALLYVEPDTLEESQEEVGLHGIDAYVLELANVVREYLEEGDECGRISDHGIAILVSRKNKQQLEAFGKAIQHAYKNVIVEAAGRSYSASCSIGLVTLGRLVNDAQSVISQARKACSEASEEGEGFLVYRPQLTAVALAEEEGTWVDRIRFALKNEDFYSVHQSIVDLDSEMVQPLALAVLHQPQGHRHALSPVRARRGHRGDDFLRHHALRTG
jgi:diguanylate cyclase (GGDEF)-like protein